MSAFEELLGKTLVSKDGERSTADALGGKTVGLYFSAHWCPPCRGFTPKLAEWYPALQAKGLEIVFASSDKDEAAWQDYFKDMPWLALPYADRDLKAKVSKQFKVSGIPTLVILNAQGEVITTDGRDKVTNDPTGKNFPWTPKPFAEVLGTSFVGKNGLVGKEAIEGKTLGLYFSAHWCPPCRGFTPQLATLYSKLQDQGKNFEIVFVSSDKDEEAFAEYYATMPWIALPFENREAKQELSGMFEIQGIPALVILDADGTVINKNARGNAGSDKEGTQFPWHPKSVNDVAQGCEGIDEKPSLVVLAKSLDSTAQEAVEAAVTQVADQVYQDAKANKREPEFNFFIAKSNEGPIGRIEELCFVTPESAITALLLDIGDDGAFYEITEPINAEVVRKSMKEFTVKTLKRKQMKN